MEVIEGRAEVSYPTRVPLKVIGRMGELQADMVAALILEHLGPQPDGGHQHHANCKGAFLSLTFWVTLENDRQERPLREAFQKLPGYVMQL
jgi:putative lipoic acid-binding regulatory protein